MQRAFTLLEFLLVVGIMAILVTITMPLALDFYRNQQLDISAKEIVQTLRRAQLKAMAVESDSSFGVYFEDSSYILFKGVSYIVGRDVQYDEIFSLSQIIKLSGIQEVVFSRVDGNPNVTGNIIVANGFENRTININPVGLINWQKETITIEIRRPTAHTNYSQRTTNPQNAYDSANGETFATTAYDFSYNPSITFHTWQLPSQPYTALVLKYRYHADGATNDRYAVAYSITGCSGVFTDLISPTSAAAPDTTVSVNLSPDQDLSQLCLKIYTQRTGGRDRKNLYTRDIWTEDTF